MHDRETASTIDDAASVWAARLDRGLAGEEQQALQAWLEGDTRRVGALARARALWSQADDAELARADTHPSSAHRQGHGLLVSRRRMLGGGLAAAAAGVLLVTQLRGRGRLIESQTGEVRRIALEDGSAVTLGSETRIRQRFDSTRRLVEVLAGDAFFEVVQDVQRPFMVTAGRLTLQAINTAFSVRAVEGLPISVLVATGRLAVANGTAGQQMLDANTRLDAPGSAPPKAIAVEPDALQRALAWRQGLLSFEGDPLATVARQFDRYGPVRIEVVDAALGGEPITGLFAANDPRGFARAIAASLHAIVETDGDVVRLRRGSA
jgi:transmembrane sensor